uniref:E3 ubiquitin-protein ligase FANCL n=2 Tax=Kalanchoe fedtschenkoi TaxID=63787 RepID=A0A7N0VDD3_KALFE
MWGAGVFNLNSICMRRGSEERGFRAKSDAHQLRDRFDCRRLLTLVLHVSFRAKETEELAMSIFYQTVQLQIEEIGWEHLVWANGDLTIMSFKILDKSGRFHILEIVLDKNYPKRPPAISSDVPHLFSLKWYPNSRLKDVVEQFIKHVEELQDFWSVMENIDKSLLVVGPEQPSRSVSFRHINIGNDCVLVVNVNADDPKSMPESRFIGSESHVSSLKKLWRSNARLWSEHKSFVENLAKVLEIQLQGPPDVDMDHRQLECGICYAQYLPTDTELGTSSGSGTDYTCDNKNCRKAFHSVCLVDWLRSITTTRQSFNVLFGACPYCSDPVAVKINNAN